jgi:hypothetical protein
MFICAEIRFDVLSHFQLKSGCRLIDNEVRYAESLTELGRGNGIPARAWRKIPVCHAGLRRKACSAQFK